MINVSALLKHHQQVIKSNNFMYALDLVILLKKLGMDVELVYG